MNHLSSTFIAQLGPLIPIILAPIWLLVFTLIPNRIANRNSMAFANFAATSALCVLGLALLSTGVRFIFGPSQFTLQCFGPISIDLYFDSIAAIMTLLVAFLGAVVLRYSVNYLAGNPRQGQFCKWLAVTIGTVLILIVSGNLLLFTLAWIAASLSLHQLLMFHADRPTAALAAWKKFFISRVGDACLIGALVMTWLCFGSWNFNTLFSAAETLRDAGSPQPLSLTVACLFLIGAALIKSAQFPFHSWLPDTMETPTPVSALMHAGIINAGGFLVIRLSPILVNCPISLDALALIGTFTALFASLIMLTQTSIKRALAYSTIAQMGFMMLECGLGAFSLAMLHIVAHSLYKAYAFLSSGSAIRLSQSAWVPSERPSAHPFILCASLMVSIAITTSIGICFGLNKQSGMELILLSLFYTSAIAYLLWNLWASSHRAGLITWGLLMSVLATTFYFSLHQAFDHILKTSLVHYSPPRSSLEYAVMTLITLLFLSVLILQSQMPVWTQTRLGRKIYVHASQGFYLGAIANRITLSLMPKPKSN